MRRCSCGRRLLRRVQYGVDTDIRSPPARPARANPARVTFSGRRRRPSPPIHAADPRRRSTPRSRSVTARQFRRSTATSQRHSAPAFPSGRPRHLQRDVLKRPHAARIRHADVVRGEQLGIIARVSPRRPDSCQGRSAAQLLSRSRPASQAAPVQTRRHGNQNQVARTRNWSASASAR